MTTFFNTSFVNKAIEEFKTLYGLENLVCRHCHNLIIDDLFVFHFLKFQAFFDKKLIITSYYRCPEYNRLVGGAISSRHLQGKAIDFIQPIADVNRIVDIAKKCGFTTILYYPDRKFFHIDIQLRAVYIVLNRKTTTGDGKSQGIFSV